MAATKGKLTKPQQENIRSRIQTTQLVNRLQHFALGLPEPNAEDGDETLCEIDPQRLKAIEILLRKSLPDLSSVAISNEGDQPFKIEDTSGGAAKLQAFLNGIAERSAEAGSAEPQ